MKELIKTKKKEFFAGKTERIEAVAIHIASGFLGLIASKAVVFGKYLPFGLSFLAGCPLTLAPSVATGVFLGYFIPAVGNGGFRYLAAMFAILAIRLMLSAFKKISENPFFLSGICFAANALTSAVTLEGLPASIAGFAAETLLSAGGTYFVCRTGSAAVRRRAGFSGDEMVSLLVTVGILLMGVSGVGAFGISLGRVLGIFLILVCAKYGGTLSGAVSGIAVTFSSVLGGASAEKYSLFSFGGMMAGLFSPYGKYAEIAVMSVSGVISSAIGGFSAFASAQLTEIILGSVLFLFLPRSAGIYLGKCFSLYPKTPVLSGAVKEVSMRLMRASSALEDVSQTVDQVSKELGRINSADPEHMINGVEKDACTGCKLRMHCWESRRDDTVTAIHEITAAVREGEYSPEEKAPDEFKTRCIQPQRISNAVIKHYRDYASHIAAQSRIDEIRSVIEDQFEGFSDMLTDLAEDLDQNEKYDMSAALSATAALKNIDIRVDECIGRVNKYGRMTLEMKLKKTEDTVLNKLKIMKVLSVACERDFGIPDISSTGTEIFISITEIPTLCVDIGVGQKSADGSALCGDAYRYFNDGKGNFVMILSDGMGTGGRAAVDGAMASGLMSRLLKAGFGYDCSLKILNSSMLFKSADESLATLDIANIDLFTGETSLYKAGAAPTVVRRSGATGKAVSTSLPVGILPDVDFDRAKIKLQNKDILLMFSDGVLFDGTDWIRAELEVWQDGSAEELAEHICECAHRRRSDGHEDDITVMAAIFKKSV